MSAYNLDIMEWVRYAQMDYDHARKAADMFHPVPIEIICYHCQQSAEKILKSYAIAKEETLIKTHDLEKLLEQCVKYTPDFNNYIEACMTLTTYATLSRYPTNIEITIPKMNQALKYAKEILEFTKLCLSELGYEIAQEHPEKKSINKRIEEAKIKAKDYNSSKPSKISSKNSHEID